MGRSQLLRNHVKLRHAVIVVLAVAIGSVAAQNADPADVARATANLAGFEALLGETAKTFRGLIATTTAATCAATGLRYACAGSNVPGVQLNFSREMWMLSGWHSPLFLN